MRQEIEKNYYELLDVMPGATEHEIEEAYKRVRGCYGETGEAMLKKINEAYEILRNPVKRREYDTGLASCHQEIYQKSNINTAQSNEALSEESSGIWKLKSDIKLKQSLVVMSDIDLLAAEQYRVLYTKLEHMNRGNFYKTFAITSAVKGEGKTITSLNLAYMMAQGFKKKVILVECDLKNPSLTSYFVNGGPQQGLIDVINGEVNLDVAIVRLEGRSLYFLPAPHNVKNSSELLDSPHMSTVLNTLKTQFDYVIIDSPPILPLADMNILSRVVDGLLLVVRAGKTSKDIVLKAANSLPTTNIVGIVLNGAAASLKKYYY